MKKKFCDGCGAEMFQRPITYPLPPSLDVYIEIFFEKDSGAPTKSCFDFCEKLRASVV